MNSYQNQYNYIPQPLYQQPQPLYQPLYQQQPQYRDPFSGLPITYEKSVQIEKRISGCNVCGKDSIMDFKTGKCIKKSNIKVFTPEYIEQFTFCDKYFNLKPNNTDINLYKIFLNFQLPIPPVNGKYIIVKDLLGESFTSKATVTLLSIIFMVSVLLKVAASNPDAKESIIELLKKYTPIHERRTSHMFKLINDFLPNETLMKILEYSGIGIVINFVIFAFNLIKNFVYTGDKNPIKTTIDKIKDGVDGLSLKLDDYYQSSDLFVSSNTILSKRELEFLNRRNAIKNGREGVVKINLSKLHLNSKAFKDLNFSIETYGDNHFQGTFKDYPSFDLIEIDSTKKNVIKDHLNVYLEKVKHLVSEEQKKLSPLYKEIEKLKNYNEKKDNMNSEMLKLHNLEYQRKNDIQNKLKYTNILPIYRANAKKAQNSFKKIEKDKITIVDKIALKRKEDKLNKLETEIIPEIKDRIKNIFIENAISEKFLVHKIIHSIETTLKNDLLSKTNKELNDHPVADSLNSLIDNVKFIQNNSHISQNNSQRLLKESSSIKLISMKKSPSKSPSKISNIQTDSYGNNYKISDYEDKYNESLKGKRESFRDQIAKGKKFNSTRMEFDDNSKPEQKTYKMATIKN